MLFFKEKKKLGIDIGTTSVKLVEVVKEKEIALSTYGEFVAKDYFEYPKGSGGHFRFKIINNDVARIIKLLIKETGARSRSVTFSLPTSSTFTTSFSMPLIPQKELAEAVSFEARQYIPLPLSEVILDWHVVNQSNLSSEGGISQKGQLEIFVAAFPKELVNNYSIIAKLADLKLKALELETFALIRSLVFPSKDPIALLDLGATSSNISIVENSFIQATHNLSISGLTIMRNLAASLGIEKERAEEIKLSQGLEAKEGEQEISKLIEPFIDAIIAESEKAIGVYTKKAGHGIIKIILSGGTANMKGFLKKFNEYFKIETVMADPFCRLGHLKILEPILKEKGPLFSIATGLAMREFA